jgi:hypothetical protein
MRHIINNLLTGRANLKNRQISKKRDWNKSILVKGRSER